MLRTFNIITESSDFTDEGCHIAFADNEDERKDLILKIVLNYPPYESLLYNIAKKRESETEIDSIIGFWGKFGYGSTERNRKDAASLFGNIMEYIGLGIFKKGRGGKHPTRIVWKPDFESQLQAIKGMKNENLKKDPEGTVNSVMLEHEEKQKKQTIPNNVNT